ncbi:2Fe-2S iron-sulfur cluster-binding protein [Eoetvoesiella caeni]|mgnify:FL=1|uniref:2Fe-2S ferredoxin n=1 Tax=Eoetvoesiella caeni TaxID=645616 RepID=A0A366HHM4_9BURK|nr:2Fe-2S iron-sulfur cluster-binding protein [Eoetvoesiella caeni]MCI2808239.1 2Fe-2S iron-sulfur cluster-binding protein [Eoetvoesiella caeni]NYT53758.1 2Fe-2S iron-sulfur cluster binding domain-containing protein [Eoetvoesiella caeni]RBP42164.1 2Fe-2S ferredoxin [Eoetvoesiella caeni]
MKINVIDRDGTLHELDATPGWKVMEVIREAGLDIKAECGGCCVCSTCHVYVDDAWVDRLPGRQDEEDEVLDDACELKETSRLSCQLLMAEELDGLTVTLAPEWA